MADPAADHLLERTNELLVLSERAAAAQRGEGGVVVLQGGAGAGKSSLLTVLRGEAAGLRVCSAYGGELEREFAFGIVHQLLDPIVRGADDAERARLLSGAAASAAPLFGVGVDRAPAGGADASFAVLHGLYWLVATLAESEPLMLVVDDLQWADEPSLRFCDFLARRASELPLLLAASVRTGERPEVDDLLVDAPATTLLEPPPLSLAATQRVIDGAVGEAVDVDVAAAAHGATGGNPLLVTELARTLARWDGAPTVAVVQAAVPSSISRSVGRRLRRLDEPAVRTAQVLAVLGDGVPSPVLAEVGGLDPARLGDSLAALEASGFTQGSPPQFVHALIRQAVLEAAPASDRGALHARAASALRRDGADQEQVVTHLLAAPPTGEPWAAELLRAAGNRAAQEGAADLAVRRLRRAVEEFGAAPDPSIFIELGMAELAAGDPRALEHLRLAADAPVPELAAGALSLLVSVGAGNAPAMADVMRRSLRMLEEPGASVAPVAAHRSMLLQTTMNALSFNPSLPGALPVVLRLAEEQDEPGTLAIRALQAAGVGARRDAVVALARRYLEGEANLGLAGLEGSNAWGAVVAANAVEAPELADPLLARLEAINRRGASRFVAYFDDQMRGARAAAAGQLTLAEALLRGARDRCLELTDAALERASVVELAAVLVRMGRLREADGLLSGVLDADDLAGPRFVACSGWTRRAELRAAQERWPEALADLQRVEAALPDWGWSRFPAGRSDALLARALFETGQTEDGAARAEAAIATARGRGIAGDEAAGLLVRMRAAATLEAGLAAAAEAAEVGARSPDLVLRAEAALAHGIALRRAGQRKDARGALADARVAANQAGAAVLLARATEEYTVAGGRPQRIAVSGVDALTPSERRTAEQAAAGLTNREIAERLFVTRKTVEFTLGRVFQKLDISSRAQLPEHLTPPAGAAGAEPDPG